MADLCASFYKVYSGKKIDKRSFFLPQYCLILDFTLPHELGQGTLQMVLHGALVLLFAPFTQFLHAFNILNVHTSCQLDKVVLVVDFHIPETCIIQVPSFYPHYISEQMEPCVTSPKVSVPAHQFDTLTQELFKS